MFTVEQIQNAHSKVKSGADFPAYIREIKSLSVTHYTAFVTDGHVDYYGANSEVVSTPPKYAPKEISQVLHAERFQAGLKAHQRGETDYLTFITMCADEGVNSWEISMDKMTCTYFDIKGQQVLVEEIPG